MGMSRNAFSVKPALQRAVVNVLFSIAVVTVMLSDSVSAADRALLIGVGQYENPRANLDGIDLDVNVMRGVAQQLGFSGSATKILMDREATQANVERTMQSWLIDGVGRDDRVFIYYSGHGTQVPDVGGDEADGSDEALVLHDFKVTNGRPSGLLVDDRFDELLRRIPSRNILLVVDACHSGTGYESFNGEMTGAEGGQTKFLSYPGMPYESSRGFAVDPKEARPGLVALMAAKDSEYAIATNRGSVFTLGIQSALKDLAGGDASITPRQVIEHTQRFVRQELARNPSKIFTPQLGGDPNKADRPLRITTGSANRDTLVGFVSRQEPLRVSANKQRFRIGDRSLRVTVDVPATGYLNIVTVDPNDKAEILFPNQFDQDNRVGAGQLSVPTPRMNFDLQAQGPVGEHIVVAIWTQQPLNLYKDGIGPRNGGKLPEGFASLSQYGIQEFSAVARQSTSAAGRLDLSMSR